MTIPEVAGEMGLSLGFERQGPEATARFRDFKVYRISKYEDWK